MVSKIIEFWAYFSRVRHHLHLPIPLLAESLLHHHQEEADPHPDEEALLRGEFQNFQKYHFLTIHLPKTIYHDSSQFFILVATSTNMYMKLTSI